MSEPQSKPKVAPKIERGIGDNSKITRTTVDEIDEVGGIVGKRLKAFIERIERLDEEKSALMEDIKEVKAEAKAAGFETKIITRIIKLRKMDVEKRREEDEILNLYMSAIGMN